MEGRTSQSGIRVNGNEVWITWTLYSIQKGYFCGCQWHPFVGVSNILHFSMFQAREIPDALLCPHGNIWNIPVKRIEWSKGCFLCISNPGLSCWSWCSAFHHLPPCLSIFLPPTSVLPWTIITLFSVPYPPEKLYITFIRYQIPILFKALRGYFDITQFIFQLLYIDYFYE